MDIIKQFNEPLALMINPRKSIEAKMGVIPRTFVSAVVGKDSLGRPHYGTEDGPFAQNVKTIAGATRQFVPIGLDNFASVLQGERDARSAGLSFFLGVGVRSESKQNKAKRDRIAQLQNQLALEGIR